MKKLAILLTAGLLALSLAGCATHSGEMGMTKVKCPACGYEFEAPAPRP